jgi:glycosyltransferase involved in cell wall biosynthesis
MWEQADFGAEADIIEAADWGFSFVPPAIEAKTPLIIQAHGSAGQIADHDPLEGEEVQGALERLTERSTLSLATSLQTYSIANAEFWRAETGRDVEMIRAAVPLTKGAATGAVSDRGLVIGRIQRWKGPHVLCQALDRLGEYAPGVDWFGRDTAFGRQGRLTGADLAERYPRVWNRRIEPRAPIPTVEVARRQAGALFNLVPSSWDVFNFTAAEAMASGRPTIVSTGAGASELVVDGENGFLFASEDAASLVGAIESVLTMSPLRLAEIGAAGRETVRRELDPMTIAAARIAAYRSAIATFAARAPAPIGGWLGEICRPSAVGPVGNAFLGQHPMRTLASHLVQRAWGKVGPAIGRKRS